MEKAVYKVQIPMILSDALYIIGGSVFLALFSQIAIPLPFTPVPITMQTFAVFLLGGWLGARRGTLSIAAYLIQGACGLPVFAGGVAKPAWFMQCSAGFLIAFLPAAYVVGKLAQRCCNRWQKIGVLLLAQGLIFLIGASWLTYFVGIKAAFFQGVLPFLSGAGIKILAASALLKRKKI